MPILTPLPSLLPADIVQHPQCIFIIEKYLVPDLEPAIGHLASEVALLKFGSCRSSRHTELHVVEDEVEDEDGRLVVDVAFVVFVQDVADVAAA